MGSTSEQELRHFAQNLAAMVLTQPRLAEALLWFHDHHDSASESSLADIASELHLLNLTGVVNKTRLERQLKTLPTVVRGSRAGVFKLKASSRIALNATYLPLLKAPALKHDWAVLPANVYANAPAYLTELCGQINMCYTARTYDGCAVLCRRVLEGLLIGAFAKAGHADEIEKQDGYYHLKDLITAAESRRWIKLSKTAIPDLKEVKEIGDRAAHHRFAITSPEDINRIGPKVRALVQELRMLAGI